MPETLTTTTVEMDTETLADAGAVLTDALRSSFDEIVSAYFTFGRTVADAVAEHGQTKVAAAAGVSQSRVSRALTIATECGNVKGVQRKLAAYHKTGRVDGLTDFLAFLNGTLDQVDEPVVKRFNVKAEAKGTWAKLAHKYGEDKARKLVAELAKLAG